MLKRIGGTLAIRKEPASAAAGQLEALGFATLRGVFSKRQLNSLRRELDSLFASLPPDRRAKGQSPAQRRQFRYEMLNRSALAQRAIGAAAILEAIEPLLGEDCHVIANTAWRNPAADSRNQSGQSWHIDAGPHVPRPRGVPWPDEIPYPIFAIGAHILLQDVAPSDGPTGVIPGSHRSGHIPPPRQWMDDALEYEGKGCQTLLGNAGDVLLFVSDVWHRRLPSGERDSGRYFLQVHYGRRDIAQRLRTTSEVNSLSPEAIGRIRSRRGRTLVGLHPPGFYDG